MSVFNKLKNIAVATEFTRDSVRRELKKIGITLKRVDSDWRAQFNPVYWKQHGVKLTSDDIENHAAEESDLESILADGKKMAQWLKTHGQKGIDDSRKHHASMTEEAAKKIDFSKINIHKYEATKEEALAFITHVCKRDNLKFKGNRKKLVDSVFAEAAKQNMKEKVLLLLDNKLGPNNNDNYHNGKQYYSIKSSIDPYEGLGAVDIDTSKPRREPLIANSEYTEIAKSDNQSFSALLSRRGWKAYKVKTLKPGEFYRSFSIDGRKTPDVVMRWMDGKPGVELAFFPALVKVGGRASSLKESFKRACEKAAKARVDAKHVKRFSEVLKKIALAGPKGDKKLSPVIDKSEKKAKGGAASGGGGGGGGLPVPIVSDKVEKIAAYMKRFKIDTENDEPKTAVEKFNNFKKMMEKVAGGKGKSGFRLQSVQYLHHTLFGDGKKLSPSASKLPKGKLVQEITDRMFSDVRSVQNKKMIVGDGPAKRKARNKRYDKSRGFKGLYHPDKEQPGFQIFEKPETDAVVSRLQKFAALAMTAETECRIEIKKLEGRGWSVKPLRGIQAGNGFVAHKKNYQLSAQYNDDIREWHVVLSNKQTISCDDKELSEAIGQVLTSSAKTKEVALFKTTKRQLFSKLNKKHGLRLDTITDVSNIIRKVGANKDKKKAVAAVRKTYTSMPVEAIEAIMRFNRQNSKSQASLEIAKGKAPAKSKKIAVKVKKKAPAKKPAKKVAKKAPAKKSTPKSPVKKSTRKAPVARAVKSKPASAPKVAAKTAAPPTPASKNNSEFDKTNTQWMHDPRVTKAMNRAREVKEVQQVSVKAFNEGFARWVFKTKIKAPVVVPENRLYSFTGTAVYFLNRWGAQYFAWMDEFADWAMPQERASFVVLAAGYRSAVSKRKAKSARKSVKKATVKKAAKKAPAKKKLAVKVKKKAPAKKAPAKKPSNRMQPKKLPATFDAYDYVADFLGKNKERHNEASVALRTYLEGFAKEAIVDYVVKNKLSKNAPSSLGKTEAINRIVTPVMLKYRKIGEQPAAKEYTEEKYKEALEAVLRDKRPTASYVMRVTRCTYNAASAMLKRMETEGHVTAEDGDGNGIRSYHAGKVASPKPPKAAGGNIPNYIPYKKLAELVRQVSWREADNIVTLEDAFKFVHSRHPNVDKKGFLELVRDAIIGERLRGEKKSKSAFSSANGSEDWKLKIGKDTFYRVSYLPEETDEEGNEFKTDERVEEESIEQEKWLREKGWHVYPKAKHGFEATKGHLTINAEWYDNTEWHVLVSGGKFYVTRTFKAPDLEVAINDLLDDFDRVGEVARKQNNVRR